MLRNALRSALRLGGLATRPVTYMPTPGDSGIKKITLIPGDGIGPAVCEAVQKVFTAIKAPVEWESFPDLHGGMAKVPNDVMDSIRRNKVALKGALRTPVGGGASSLNIQIRKEMDLYAHLAHCFSVKGFSTRHSDVDIVVIRENTEGEYSGLEHEVVPGIVESLKIITEKGSLRIAKYAFEYAYMNGRKKVSAVHKANIMKQADGLFLECCRKVSKEYPTIQFEEIIVDNCCMQMVSNPSQFDVMVTPNLYGTLVSNVGAGLASSTGVVPGGSVGAHCAVFEQGASAGNVDTGMPVEEGGEVTANPTAMLLSSAMMLRHLNLPHFGDRIEKAVLAVIAGGKHHTPDMGGVATTANYTDAVIKSLATQGIA